MLTLMSEPLNAHLPAQPAAQDRPELVQATRFHASAPPDRYHLRAGVPAAPPHRGRPFRGARPEIVECGLLLSDKLVLWRRYRRLHLERYPNGLNRLGDSRIS